MTAPWVLRGAVACAAYLLGSVPFGLLVARVLGGTDIRRTGSGNIGATNVGRSLGAGAGILTLLLDLSKGALAAWLGGKLAGVPEGACLAGLAAVLGHVFPIYLGLKGGKGVATGLGAFLVLDLSSVLAAAAIFLAGVAATRRVSVGSMLGALSLPVIICFRDAPPVLSATAWVCSLLILLRHRENLVRLVRGTEPKLGAGKP